MKKASVLLTILLIINLLCSGQSITLVPLNPADPTKGTIKFDNVSNLLTYWNGSVWIPITNAASGTGWAANGNHISNANTGNVGIGTTTPKATLQVAVGKTVIFGDSAGAGSKLIWYGAKAAFRAGYNFLDEFDTANVGLYSIAMGSNSKATGNYSMSLGSGTSAINEYSFAMGSDTKASGLHSTAMGYSTTASGDYSTSMGYLTAATAPYSTATGYATTASGQYSTAMGRYANTFNHTNSFCIAGASGNTAAFNTTDNQMLMRFDNYTFWVSPANYAYLTTASNGWAYTSDMHKKENFLELNGESVLKKIAKIPLYSWNFKAKETKQYRHYGIMAQEFFGAFGKDDLGVVGNDTTVSALDLLGVAYSGIKALEKRTELLQTQNQQLMEELAILKAMIQPKRRKYAFHKSKETGVAEKMLVKNKFSEIERL